MAKIVRCTCGKETTVTKGSPEDRKWKYRLPYRVREEGLAEGWYCGNPKHHFVDPSATELTSRMRKNERWAASMHNTVSEPPLIEE